MLTQVFVNAQERGTAVSFALGGVAMGVLTGFPFGGLLYYWSGKELPFLILAAAAVVGGSK